MRSLFIVCCTIIVVIAAAVFVRASGGEHHNPLNAEHIIDKAFRDEPKFTMQDYKSLSELATQPDAVNLVLSKTLPHMGGAAKKMCDHHAEHRRNFDCVAVKQSLHNVCCWQTKQGDHGLLPHECCGTGWSTHQCQAIINEICLNFHPMDSPKNGDL